MKVEKMKKLSIGCLMLLTFATAISCKKSNNSLEDKDANVTVVNKQARSEKRGVSYGFQLMEDVDLLSPGVSWFYNWGNDIPSALDQATKAKGMDYFPMTWNGNFNKDKIRAYKQKHPECEYLLAYNEPNLTDQANMTPEEAAAIFPEVLALATELNMKLISPAMNYGTLANYSDPIKWLDEFFALVPLSNFDGIALHSYMAVPSSFKSYVDRFKKYNKKIWMTEFCAWEPSISNANQQIKYMSDVVNYMEGHPDIFRYAWFIPRTNGAVDSYPFMQLLTKSQPYALSDAGKVYVNLSTFDKNTYYTKGEAFPAAHYVNLNSTASATQPDWVSTIHIRPTTDKAGEVEVYDFFKDLWIEYQIEVPATGNYSFDLRYASYRDASIELTIDGASAKTLELPNTGEDNIWRTSNNQITLSQGKHTVRIKMASGTTCLNWLRFN